MLAVPAALAVVAAAVPQAWHPFIVGVALLSALAGTLLVSPVARVRVASTVLAFGLVLAFTAVAPLALGFVCFAASYSGNEGTPVRNFAESSLVLFAQFGVWEFLAAAPLMIIGMILCGGGVPTK